MQEGCTGLAPFGTTSEGNSLGSMSAWSCWKSCRQPTSIRPRLMPGTGAPLVSDAIVLTKHAVELGCGGVLMLPPYYYKAPSEEGCSASSREVIEGVDDDDLKVYLYTSPGAQVGFSLPLIGRLIKAFPETVVGLKDSSGDWSNTAAILEPIRSFEVFPARRSSCSTACARVPPAASRRPATSAQRLFASLRQLEGRRCRPTAGGHHGPAQGHPGLPDDPALKALVAHYRKDRAGRRCGRRSPSCRPRMPKN
jgi:4-hydroxy-tetrahydrodipicolinate synthase